MIVAGPFPQANGALFRRFRPTWIGLLASTVLFAVPAGARTSNSGSAAPPVKSLPPTAAGAPLLTVPPDRIAQPPETVTEGEMRGLWVVRSSLTSPESVRNVVLTAAKYHFNTLFVQVRGRGDAWYNSPYEPKADQLSRQAPDFDPLLLLIGLARAQGLQVHAWLNTYLAWSGARSPSSPRHVWNAHRDWFSCDRNGKCSAIATNACEGAFLQPSNPAVQQHLFNVFTDVAKRYDLDGIHFDYCRYAGHEFDFSASTLARFRTYIGEQKSADVVEAVNPKLAKDRLAFVHAFGAEWAEWRRAQITTLVARISTAVKEVKPWMQISAAVFPDADEAFAERGQDWRGWLKAGYLDAVALMAYNKSTERILEQTRKAVEAAGDKQVYTGIGAWRLSAHDVAEKIAKVRATGAAGVNLFSYDGIHTRPEYLDTLVRGVFASRSAPRRMSWLPGRDGFATRPSGAADDSDKPTLAIKDTTTDVTPN